MKLKVQFLPTRDVLRCADLAAASPYLPREKAWIEILENPV